MSSDPTERPQSAHPPWPTKAHTARVTRRVLPIKRQRPLHQEAVDRLRDMIVEGDIAAGERLNEALLAERLQISRTPLREALKILANEGLVDLLPGRGARASALSAETVSELFEVIAGLERLAVELAAARMTTKELERLQRMHERMAVLHAAGDRRAYSDLNRAIHCAIVAGAKNRILQSSHQSLMIKARRGRFTALASQARWIEAMEEHNRLMAMLLARDSSGAGEILLHHDLRTAEVVRDMIAGSAPQPSG